MKLSRIFVCIIKLVKCFIYTLNWNSQELAVFIFCKCSCQTAYILCGGKWEMKMWVLCSSRVGGGGGGCLESTIKDTKMQNFSLSSLVSFTIYFFKNLRFNGVLPPAQGTFSGGRRCRPSQDPYSALAHTLKTSYLLAADHRAPAGEAKPIFPCHWPIRAH
jgi:hypothetical protein